VQGFVKICGLDELPPGKGKVVAIGGREVHVFNREGRISARVAGHCRSGVAAGAQAGLAPPGEAVPVCIHAGSRFEVEQEDSPARAHAEAASVHVRVREGAVYVAVEGGGAVARQAGLA
jgi:nitrite reductase/ring-hydroxylating ferredoxin subunit